MTVTNASTAHITAETDKMVNHIGEKQISGLLDQITKNKEITLEEIIHKDFLYGRESRFDGVVARVIAPKEKMSSEELAGYLFDSWKLMATDKKPTAIRAVKAQTDGKPVELMSFCLYPDNSDKDEAKNFCLGRDDASKMPKKGAKKNDDKKKDDEKKDGKEEDGKKEEKKKKNEKEKDGKKEKEEVEGDGKAEEDKKDKRKREATAEANIEAIKYGHIGVVQTPVLGDTQMGRMGEAPTALLQREATANALAEPIDWKKVSHGAEGVACTVGGLVPGVGLLVDGVCLAGAALRHHKANHKRDADPSLFSFIGKAGRALFKESPDLISSVGGVANQAKANHDTKKAQQQQQKQQKPQGGKRSAIAKAEAEILQKREALANALAAADPKVLATLRKYSGKISADVVGGGPDRPQQPPSPYKRDLNAFLKQRSKNSRPANPQGAPSTGAARRGLAKRALLQRELATRDVEYLVARDPNVKSFINGIGDMLSSVVKRDGTEISARDIQRAISNPSFKSFFKERGNYIKRDGTEISARDLLLIARDPLIQTLSKKSALSTFIKRAQKGEKGLGEHHIRALASQIASEAQQHRRGYRKQGQKNYEQRKPKHGTHQQGGEASKNAAKMAGAATNGGSPVGAPAPLPAGAPVTGAGGSGPESAGAIPAPGAAPQAAAGAAPKEATLGARSGNSTVKVEKRDEPKPESSVCKTGKQIPIFGALIDSGCKAVRSLIG
ncbi:MAG: hypothetical protein Q9187_007924 [Circinaria calcarea]